jgi:hypothetical protein
MKFIEKHTKHKAAGNNHNGIHRRQLQIEYSMYTMLPIYKYSGNLKTTSHTIPQYMDFKRGHLTQEQEQNIYICTTYTSAPQMLHTKQYKVITIVYINATN